jgi:hypothetical protein
MEMTKEYIQGYCDAIIASHDRTEIKAKVEKNFFGGIDITISWEESYHPNKNNKIGGYMVFSEIQDIKALGSNISNFLLTKFQGNN